MLRRCKDAVTPALAAAVSRLDPASREQTAYHLGWTELDGSPCPTGGGKAVRPALAVLSAEAAGADVATGLPGAVAVELVHNFSLLHDDLIDGDSERRHRPTVWAQWGAAAAILSGDALLALALEVLLEAPSPHGPRAAVQLAATVRELVRGQVEDVAFEQRSDVGVEECLTMAAGKTGSLLATSAAIGAVLAGAPPALTAALHTFGAEVGAAFQLVDDLLGIWGDPAVTGKPVLSDLRSRKKSLPVTYAVHHGGADGRELARLARRHRRGRRGGAAPGRRARRERRRAGLGGRRGATADGARREGAGRGGAARAAAGRARRARPLPDRPRVLVERPLR